LRIGREIPGWLTVLAILATAALTTWAMVASGRDLGSPAQASVPYMPADAAKLLAPGLASAEEVFGRHEPPPSAEPTPPVILAGASQVHGDRGACTTCHVVVGDTGQPVVAISAQASLPHRFRGMCTNCHTVVVGTPVAGGPAAAGDTLPVAQRLGLDPIAGLPVAAAPVATEGSWLGLEVSPITSTSATRYGIPPSTEGLLVAEGEADARAAGIKAGDVVVAINGVPIEDLTTFFFATKNGTLSAGTVEVIRQGELLGFRLPPAAGGAGQPQTPPAQVPAPTVAPVAPALDPAWACPRVTPPAAPAPATVTPSSAGPPPDPGWVCPRVTPQDATAPVGGAGQAAAPNASWGCPRVM
jgi:hypothetical protein